MFEHTDSEKLNTALLTALVNNPTSDIKLNNELANIAWGIWDTVQNQREDRTFNKLR